MVFGSKESGYVFVQNRRIGGRETGYFYVTPHNNQVYDADVSQPHNDQVRDLEKTEPHNH